MAFRVPIGSRKPKPGIESLLEELSQDPEVRAVLKKETLEPSDKEVVRRALKRKIASSLSDDYQQEEESHPQEPHEEIEKRLQRALEVTLEKGIEPGLKIIRQAPVSEYPYLLDAYHAELLKELWPYLEGKSKE